MFDYDGSLLLDGEEELFSDECDASLDDSMSTIKKHLTTDAKHVLPTYKKLPPIPSPPPYNGLTITKISKTKPGTDGSVGQITSSDQKGGYNGKSMLAREENGVKLIGYKSLDDQKKGYMPPGSELPPCRICGVKASGLHYGVNTCEACKAFFRRTLKKDSVDFQCMCSPTDKKRNMGEPPRKTSCARCRYDRCIREGMSKEAIKIGRYTINRKRQNDREVHMLKEQGGVVGRKFSESSPKSSSSADSPASSSDPSVSSSEVMSPDTTTKSDGEESNIGVANKRLKRNDGQAMAKGFLDTLTNSLFHSLMQNQDSPVLNGTVILDTQLTPLENEYIKQFEAQNSVRVQYKTTVQVGRDGQYVGPISGVQPAQIQRSGNVGQPLIASKFMPRQTTGPTAQRQDMGGMVQNASVTSSQQKSTEFGMSNHVTSTQTSPHVSTSGVEGETEPKSLIETLFEADGTVPVQNETSAIEDLLNGGGVISPSSMPLSHSQTTVPGHMTQGVSSNIYSPGKQIANSMEPEDCMNELLNAEGLFPGDPLDFPLENLSDKEIATKLKSMQNLQQMDDDLLGSLDDNFNLSDEVIASKLKSMEAHTLENDALIASKLKSMEEQDFRANENKLLNGQLGAGESDLSAPELDSLSRQYCEEREKLTSENNSPMLDGLELSEFEMYQPQSGQPVKPAMPMTADQMEAACRAMIDVALAAMVCPLKLSCDEIVTRHKAYLEQYTLKKKVFGDLNNIPEEEYIKFYNQTGIDIDNRQEILIEYLQYAEQCISELVTFAKVIPGFTELPIDDQLTLLKSARFSSIMIKDGLYGGQCQATAYQVATMPWNKDYHFEELKKIAPKEMFGMKAEVYEKVFEIGMTMEESIIVRAMAITYPKNEDLTEPDKVEVIHNNLTECLLYQLRKRSTGKKPSLTSIFELLFYLREKSVTEQQYMVEMFETFPLTNNHQLLKEFVT